MKNTYRLLRLLLIKVDLTDAASVEASVNMLRIYAFLSAWTLTKYQKLMNTDVVIVEDTRIVIQREVFGITIRVILI